MPLFLSAYSRTVSAAGLILLLLLLGYGGVLGDIYPGLLGLFEWLETTPFGYIGKTWGAAFAFVEAIHLLGLAVLGGCVIASDGRLLNLVLTDVPAQTVFDRTHRVFVWALITLLATGVFMACGVATKVYYLPVYWYKMLALSAGMLFHFFIRKPLLAHDLDELNPVVTKMVAIASILVWFMVAATGRWIGLADRENFNMNDVNNDNSKKKDDETAALLVAQSFIIFSAIYWFLQIESVRELLQLAYG